MTKKDEAKWVCDVLNTAFTAYIRERFIPIEKVSEIDYGRTKEIQSLKAENEKLKNIITDLSGRDIGSLLLTAVQALHGYGADGPLIDCMESAGKLFNNLKVENEKLKKELERENN